MLDLPPPPSSNTGCLRRWCEARWDRLPPDLQLRIHRALSWLDRAEQERDDLDAAFIFYWIAFNAIYAEDTPEAEVMSERSIFEEYFEKILAADSDRLIYDALWNRFSQEIRVFLNNKFVYAPFWRHQNGVRGYDDWAERFEGSKRLVHYALGRGNTMLILRTLFDRLYVLRNQLVHGGATWQSSVNRDQVRDGRNIVAFLTPRFVRLMAANPQVSWGAPYYPVVS